MCPVSDDSEARQIPAVRPSAPMEMIWICHQLLNPRADAAKRLEVYGDKLQERLARRLRRFWGDESTAGAGELVILADFAGQLFSTDLEQLVPDIPVPRQELTELPLRSEDPADRRRFIDRLVLLQRDGRLRRRYGAMLQEIWEPLQPAWQQSGLPQIEATCGRVARRLSEGSPLTDVVPVVSEVERRKPDWRALIEGAEEENRLAVVPGYFGTRWTLWDLPSRVVLGFNEATDSLVDLRERGRQLAKRLRVLGDPTRLGILLYLAETPISVGELATRFGLAQPTVSAHLHALREASLVSSRRQENRNVYRADRSEIAHLLRDVAAGAGADLLG